jgi:seryl-tRNA synthetase
MIDLALLRTNKDHVIAQLKRKDPHYNAERLFELDVQVRQLRISVDLLRKQKNDLATAGKTGVSAELRQQSIELGQEIKQKEQLLQTVEVEFEALYLAAPNLPDDSLPNGGKEANKVVREWQQKPSFAFPIKNHVQLAEQLGWVDFHLAAKMTGSNFAFYKNDGVKLLYALGMFMLKNNIKHGFSPVLPPLLVTEKCLQVSGNFPKFKDQVYAVPGDNLFLTPTSEVNIANIYRDHIFDLHDLPVRMTAFTSCFRREAGTYGATERGLIRIHQFEKVELYSIVSPEESYNELERMVACAETILQALGLHYRVSLLATQDCSFQSAKTYDIEVWVPGQDAYLEVSSASNCTDFQARRGLMRYKKNADSKAEPVHTLNASSLALPRLMVALMETYQQPDGTIEIPEVLKKEGIW